MPWTDDDIRKAAKAQYHEDGSVEIDDDAKVSVVEDGAYVQAWVWVATPKPQESET